MVAEARLGRDRPGPAAARDRSRWRAAARHLAIAAALVLLLAACGDGDSDAAESAGGAASAAESARSVRVVQVDTGPLVATRSAAVTLRPAQESRVAAGTSGRVAEVLAREGAAVDAGAPLMRLDDAQARSAVDGAELALAQAQIQLDRARRNSTDAVGQAAAGADTAERNLALIERQLAEAESLLTLGAIAPSDVEALRTQRAQAEGAVLQARDAVGRSGRAEDEELALLSLQLRQAEVQLRGARDALAETVVRAPFAGDVAELFAEVGEFVGAGSPVARLLGGGPKLASFTVPPEDAPILERAGTLTVTYAGEELPATILRLERQAQQARLVTVLAQIDAGAPRTPPGALAEVRYEITLGEGLRVPSGALFADAGRSYLYQVETTEAGDVARRTEVRVVAESGNVAIVAGAPEEALRAGARVLSPRPLDVRDGTLVRVLGE